jgi:LAO/AO transport system kinase
MDLASKVVQGDVLSAARLIRCLEDEVEGASEQLEALYLKTGRAHVVGVTGAPGAGKSTLVGCLIGKFRAREMKVGVVAVDPSSPFSGGAILGDRVRMQSFGVDKEVFIRSLASRGWKGGLSRATLSTVHVMDAMGKDVILVEAVGSGQADTDIAWISDTTILVMNPGAGDEVQMMKAGILEAADVLVVNKSDVAGADQMKHGLEVMVAMTAKNKKADAWTPPVLMAQAACDKGTEEIAEAVARHKEHLTRSGELQRRRTERARVELAWAVEYYLNQYIDGMDQDELARMVEGLARRTTNPRAVAVDIISRVAGDVR